MSTTALRTFLKRAITGGAARLGYEVIPAWRLRTLDHCRQLAYVLRQFDVDTVFDVGANEGGYRRLLRDYVGYHGQIVSFEPVPEVFARLAADAAGDARWTGHRLALGDVDSELEINLTQRSTMSSFLSRDEARLEREGYTHLLRVTDVVGRARVAVRRLDTVLDEVLPGAASRRLFLKCDTQGFDLQVIAGAERTLAQVMALQIELSMRPIYAGAPGYREVLEQMERRGFDVAGIYPVRRDELSRIVNVDCLMVNSRHPGVRTLAADLVHGREPIVA